MFAAVFLLGGLSGCAALSNPVGDAVPVRKVPPELLGGTKDVAHTIPLSLLGQPQPDAYRLARGDTLAVFIDGILGDRTGLLPVNVAPPIQIPDQRRLTPSLGYPVTVQPDGTVALPRLEKPLFVEGMTLAQARDAIRDTYGKAGLIKPALDRVLVSLLQPRQTEVLVFRQERANFALLPPSTGLFATTRRGTGHLVQLPAYENDVLHALTLTGGLPGLDCYNEVIIQRACFRDRAAAAAMLGHADATKGGTAAAAVPPTGLLPGQAVVRIPLRLPPGQPLPVHPEDVVLHQGDVVFLEARDDEVFYSGGLLPPGAFILPRDHDLDVVSAVALVRGPLINGDFGGSNLSGDLVKPGIGNPSATLLVVVRRTPGGGQVAIKVDLGRALRDPRERIPVHPGDVLILQEKPEEALARVFTQTIFNFDIFAQVFHSRFATGVLDVSAPDRLPGRLGTVNTTPSGR
jgi:protein involved in polysaccharide export with SLBB domain